MKSFSFYFYNVLMVLLVAAFARAFAYAVIFGGHNYFDAFILGYFLTEDFIGYVTERRAYPKIYLFHWFRKL